MMLDLAEKLNKYYKDHHNDNKRVDIIHYQMVWVGTQKSLKKINYGLLSTKTKLIAKFTQPLPHV